MMSPADRDRLIRVETLLGEIHIAVVGERVGPRLAVVETEMSGHKSHHRWSSARSIAMAAATALGTAIGMKFMVGV